MKFSRFCCPPLNLWTKDAVDAQNFSRPLIYLSGRRVYLFVYRAQRVQIISECVLICVITYFFNFHFFMCMIDTMWKIGVWMYKYSSKNSTHCTKCLNGKAANIRKNTREPKVFGQILHLGQHWLSCTIFNLGKFCLNSPLFYTQKWIHISLSP